MFGTENHKYERIFATTRWKEREKKPWHGNWLTCPQWRAGLRRRPWIPIQDQPPRIGARKGYGALGIEHPREKQGSFVEKKGERVTVKKR